MVSPLFTEAILGLDFMLKHNVLIDVEWAKFNLGQKASIPIT